MIVVRARKKEKGKERETENANSISRELFANIIHSFSFGAQFCD